MTVGRGFREWCTVARSWSTTYGHPGVLDNGVSSPLYMYMYIYIYLYIIYIIYYK